MGGFQNPDARLDPQNVQPSLQAEKPYRGILGHVAELFDRLTSNVNMEGGLRAANDPRTALRDIIESSKDLHTRGQLEDLKDNKPILGNIHKALSYVPMVGPAASQALDEVGSGDYGQALGDIIPLLMLKGGPESISKTTNPPGNLRANILKAVLSQHNSPEALNALKESNVPVSVGQATGSPVAKIFEKISGGGNAQKLNATQAQAMSDYAKGTIKPDFPGTIQALSEKLKDKSDLEKAAIGKDYKKFNLDFANTETPHNEIDPNNTQAPSGLVGPDGQPVQSSPKLRPINKPIELSKSLQTAQDIKDDLENRYPNPAIMDSSTRKVLNHVNEILDSPSSLDVSGQKTGIPVKSYEAVKGLKDTLNDNINHDTGAVISKEAQGIQKKLAANLSDDINGSLKKYDAQTGGNLHEQYSGAGQDYKELATKVNPGAVKTLIDAGIDPDIAYNRVLQPAFNDAKFAKQFTSALGRARTGPLAMDNLSKIGYNAVTKEFDPAAILNELDKNRDSYKELMTSNRLSNYERTIKAFAAMKPINEVGALGHGATRSPQGIAIGLPHSIAGAALGAAGLATHPLATLGTSAAAGVGYLMMRGFTNKMLLDPTVSRLLYDSSKTPVTSTAYVPLQKRLLVSLAGANMVLNQNGKKTPVTISKNGNVVSDTPGTGTGTGKHTISFDGPSDDVPKHTISFGEPEEGKE